MAQVFRMGAWTRMRHVILPQLAPYLAAAARSGLSLVWKIVLIVELLGIPNLVKMRSTTRVASFGVGTTSHLAGELFKVMAEITLVHVPYRGDALALTDTMSGQVQATFSTVPASLEYVRTGKLRALGVTTATRHCPTFLPSGKLCHVAKRALGMGSLCRGG